MDSPQKSGNHEPGLKMRLLMWLVVLGAGSWAQAQLSPAISAPPGCQYSEGGLIRGPTNHKQIALVFTGHTFAEGGDTILNALARHHAHGSFFLTGVFLANTNFAPLIQRIVQEGHYLGPHSDQHVLYCPWDGPKKTLVTPAEFRSDLRTNLQKIAQAGVSLSGVRYFLPPYEYYNAEIVDWSRALGLTVVNYTPGTRSNADYLGEADPHFLSSAAIFASITRYEQKDPHGLNGFILLTHLGVGPDRKDKFASRFGELLDYLSARGYQFVRIDELLAPPKS